MHEKHQVEKLIKDIQQLAETKKATKVTKVTLLMGDLLGFDDKNILVDINKYSSFIVTISQQLNVLNVVCEDTNYNVQINKDMKKTIKQKQVKRMVRL